MRPDIIDIQRHEADVVQAEAELKWIDAETRRHAAEHNLDAELNLSTKRAEFQRRLREMRGALKDDLARLMNQYQSDWESFKNDYKSHFDKMGKVGKTSIELLEARIDGLNARIQYLAGLAKERDARDAEKINQSLDSVLGGFRALSEEVRTAIREHRLESDEAIAAYDQRLQEYSKKAEMALLARSEVGPDKGFKH